LLTLLLKSAEKALYLMQIVFSLCNH